VAVRLRVEAENCMGWVMFRRELGNVCNTVAAGIRTASSSAAAAAAAKARHHAVTRRLIDVFSRLSSNDELTDQRPHSNQSPVRFSFSRAAWSAPVDWIGYSAALPWFCSGLPARLHFDSTERVGISLFQTTVSDECLTVLSFHTGII